MRTLPFFLGLCTLNLSSTVLADLLFATPKSPKPPNAACGILKEPVDNKRTTRLLVSSSITPTQEGCANLCVNTPSCAVFTYRPSEGTCNIYKKTDRALQTQPSADSATRFFNRKCFDTLSRFQILASADQDSDYNGKYIAPRVDDNGNRAYFVSSPLTDGTGVYVLDDNGVIHSEDVDQDGAQVQVSGSFATLYFPAVSAQQGTSFSPVSCEINAISGGSGVLNCSGSSGSNWWGCIDNDSANAPDSYGTGLALSGTTAPVVNKFMTCLPASLQAIFL